MYRAETLQKEISKLQSIKQQLNNALDNKTFFSADQLKSFRAYRTRINKKLSSLNQKFKRYYNG